MKRFLSAKILFVFIPLFLLFIILAYFQLFYRPPIVESGMATLVRTFTDHQSIVTAVRFSANDSLVVTGSVDSSVKIWERHSGKVLTTIRQPHGIAYMDLSDDGKLIATGSY